MFSLLNIFSGKDKKSEKHSFKIQSKQDSIHRKVTQTISDEIVTFSYSDFNNLKQNKAYDRFLVGELYLPTGKVICADPMYREWALQQTWKVAPGNYPVYLYIGLQSDFEGRVAYAELIIKDEVPYYWEMSLIPEILLKDTIEKKMNGMYPVENGLSCFTDVKIFQIYNQEIVDFYLNNKDGNYYDDILDIYFKANRNVPASSRGEDWINYKPLNAEGNIIMFGTGYGDGMYPRYVGYDKNGNVVKFLTDFIQIEKQESE